MPELTPIQRADEAYTQSYYESVGMLNRKERRTVHGRQLVAEAQAEALQKRCEALEEALKELTGE